MNWTRASVIEDDIGRSILSTSEKIQCLNFLFSDKDANKKIKWVNQL